MKYTNRTPAGLVAAGILLFIACNPKLSNGLRKKDLGKDVEVITSKGTLVIRLSDSTPLHRNNFLLLAKTGYYDGVLFHRVIPRFMIQAGEGKSEPGYTIPAEFRPGLFHHRGALGAARESDEVNPTRASSGSQFYIVQGRHWTDAGLDSVETFRLKGRKIPADQREMYKQVGGSPHLDQGYTVFGEVVRGMETVDSIEAAETSGPPRDRPKIDVKILNMRLIPRNK
jgi:peptidyl-prolyl cis-trans isomerase B (cyclophilin B)